MDMHHYTECGLDNVWLVNGYDVETFGDHGAAFAVHNERQLWQVVARSIARQDGRMVGQEFRFLRSMDLTQTAVGRRLGHAGYQTVASWERRRRQPVPPAADALMRAWYLESIGERPMMSRINERLTVLAASAANEHRRVLREPKSEAGWEAEEAPGEMEFA